MNIVRGALVILWIAVPAVAQTEKITIFADASMTACSVNDVSPGIIELHLFHLGSLGSAGVSFTAPTPPCWNAVWLQDTIVVPGSLFLGSSHGPYLDVAYGACIASPIYIGRMSFLASGNGQSCCEYPILKSYFPTPVSVECSLQDAVEVSSGSVTINENASCLCDPPLATQESTWGRVKALYR